MKDTILFLNKFFKKRYHPFNKAGKDKLNYANFEYESSKEIFDRFSSLLNLSLGGIVKNKSVLDLGCGAGGKSVYILENGANKVIGVDMSTILINQARNFVESNQVSGDISFIEGDIQALPFKDSSFDILIANDLMEHVDDPERMLFEAFRVLKKNGRILINFEPYYHFLGHHMWDAINIPWAHILFSEKSRIAAYKELVKELPDGVERIDFRISTSDKGEEYIGYLNHITYNRFKELVEKSEFIVEKSYIVPISKFPFNILSKIPLIQEFCISKIIYSLKKV